MINIGVQTKGIVLEQGIEKGFATIRRAGFDRVDFNLDVFLTNTDLYAGKVNRFFDCDPNAMVDFFQPYRAAMEKYDLQASQMHAPYPIYVNGKREQNAYMAGTVIPKSILIAEMLGIPWIVVHPAKLQYLRGIEEEHRVNLEILQEMVPLLKQCQVGICVENLYEGIGQRITEGTCANPDDAVWYVDTLNEYAGEELFGICMDTGHLQLTKRSASDYIRATGSRLKILHLHENDGVGDLHQMPYTFGKTKEDGLNWSDIAHALKDIRFDGTLSFETFPCMNSFPQGMEEQVLKTIYAIGCSLREEINE